MEGGKREGKGETHGAVGLLLSLKKKATALPLRHRKASKPQEVLRGMGRRGMRREVQAAKNGCHFTAGRATSTSGDLGMEKQQRLQVAVSAATPCTSCH